MWHKGLGDYTVPVLVLETGTVLRGKLGRLKNMDFVEEVLFFGRK